MPGARLHAAEFADVAVAALKQWTFIPARWQGEPVGTVDELDFYSQPRAWSSPLPHL